MSAPVRVVVLSGKGGVGKSTISVSVAIALAKRGKKVVLFDTDVDGPNCRRLCGVQDKTMVVDQVMHPIKVNENLLLYSVDGHPFIGKENYAPVWLGEQHRSFLAECLESCRKLELNPDFIVFDAPANHGDELHTIAHILGGVDQAIVVTAPSVVSTDNVALALKAMRELKWPVLGLIENMSHFTCSHGERYYVLGQGHGRELAIKEGIEFLGEIPLNPAISGRMAETGETFNNPVIYDVVQRLERKRSLWARLTGGGVR